jgi:hypothetical protein
MRLLSLSFECNRLGGSTKNGITGRKTEVNQRTAHYSMTRPVCWIMSAQRRCCCANMVATHVQACAQAPGRRCQKRRSPFPAVKRRPAKKWPITQREDQCTIPRVLSIVAVAPMWSCRMCTFVLRFHAKDLMASPVYVAGWPTLRKVCRCRPR